MKKHSNCSEKLKPSEADFKCSICGKPYKSEIYLNRHINTHTRSETYKCPLCDRIFYLSSACSRHFATHTQGKLWPCNLCTKSFSTENSLKCHMTLHNREQQRYECKVCLKRFLYVSQYNQHKTIHSHSLSFLCDKCGETFAFLADLKNHHKTHRMISKQHSCTHCGKKFISLSRWTRHVVNHECKKEYVCLICGARYFYQQSVTRHMRGHGYHGDISGAVQVSSREDIRPNKNVEKENNLHESDSDGSKSSACTEQEIQVRGVHPLQDESLLTARVQRQDSETPIGEEVNADNSGFEESNRISLNDKYSCQAECDVGNPLLQGLSKQIISENVASLLSTRQDFRSTKAIPPLPVLPPRIGREGRPADVPGAQSTSRSSSSSVDAALLHSRKETEVITSDDVISSNSHECFGDDENIREIEYFKKVIEATGFENDEKLLLTRAADLILT